MATGSHTLDWGDTADVAADRKVESAGEQVLRDVDRRLGWVGWTANGIAIVVVSVVVGFLAEIFFDHVTWGYLARLLPILAVYFVIAGLTITHFARRRLDEAYAWIREDRPPSEREHRLALGHAYYNTLWNGVCWLVGGAVFVVASLDQSFGFIAAGAAAGMLGAETTSGIVYLLAERVLRPLTALALAARPATKPLAPSVRTRLQFAWSLGTGVPLLGLLLVGTAALLAPDTESAPIAGAVIFLAVVALLVGWLATAIASRAIADPLTRVRKAVDQVGQGDLNVSVAIDDASEVGLLQAGVNRMAEGLAERERIRDLFGRQVGHDVARAALRNGTRLGGEEREIGAVYVDLTGSTSIAMVMPAGEVVHLLNRFFRVVVEVVEAEGGLVNKFEGDAALCVFGAPVASDDPAGAALRAARALSDRLAREVPEVEFGIGVSAGKAVAGNVGAEQRFEYTVIGDPVNEAARLCDLAKERSERVLASETALSRAAEDESGAWDARETAILRGRGVPTSLARPRA
jgi:adenylate cyclase